MSHELIRIDLQRDDDDWTAKIVGSSSSPGLVGETFDGSGPADALEQLGQTLDVVEVQRIKRERGI